jgi:hypothetical protein
MQTSTFCSWMELLQFANPRQVAALVKRLHRDGEYRFYSAVTGSQDELFLLWLSMCDKWGRSQAGMPLQSFPDDVPWQDYYTAGDSPFVAVGKALELDNSYPDGDFVVFV